MPAGVTSSGSTDMPPVMIIIRAPLLRKPPTASTIRDEHLPEYGTSQSFQLFPDHRSELVGDASVVCFTPGRDDSGLEGGEHHP